MLVFLPMRFVNPLRYWNGDTRRGETRNILILVSNRGLQQSLSLILNIQHFGKVVVQPIRMGWNQVPLEIVHAWRNFYKLCALVTQHIRVVCARIFHFPMVPGHFCVSQNTGSIFSCFNLLGYRECFWPS